MNSKQNNLKIDEFTYYGKNCQFGNVTIGKFCSIASNVSIGLGIHPTNEFISTFPAFFSKENSGCKISFVEDNLFEELKPVYIGHDVWIGTKAIVLDGITVGNGAIIGAGAVVTKNIPAYAIAVGVPAKVIKYRFSKEKIALLEDFKWWDKSITWIVTNAKYFQTQSFFEKLKNNSFDTEDFNIQIKNLPKKVSDENYNFSTKYNKIYAQITSIKCDKVVVYGNGTVGKTIQALIPEKIIGYVDIADEYNYPKNLMNMQFDKIIISVLGREDEIIKYLVDDLRIDRAKIITLEI